MSPAAAPASAFVTGASGFIGRALVARLRALGTEVCTIVRPGDVYGPGSRPWTLEPVRLLKEGRFALPAGGHGLLSLVHVDDLVDGIVRAAVTPEAAGRVLTLTGPEPVTVRELAARYARMLGVPEPRSVPAPVARAGAAAIDAAARLRGNERNELTPAAIDYLCRRGTYSIARARALVGYAPRVDLAEGMARTEDRLRRAGVL